MGAVLIIVALWLTTPVLAILLIWRWRKSTTFSLGFSRLLSVIYYLLILAAVIDLYLLFYTNYSLVGFWTDFGLLFIVFSLAVLLASKSYWKRGIVKWTYFIPAFLLAFYVPGKLYNSLETHVLYSNTDLRIEEGNGFIQRAGYRLIRKAGLTEYEDRYSNHIHYRPDCKIENAYLKNDSLHLIVNCGEDSRLDTLSQ